MIHGQHGQHEVGLLFSRPGLVDLPKQRPSDSSLYRRGEIFSDEVRGGEPDIAMFLALIDGDLHEVGYHVRPVFFSDS